MVALLIDCDAVLRDDALLAICGTVWGQTANTWWCQYIKTRAGRGQDRQGTMDATNQTWPILEQVEEKRMLFCMKKAKPR